MPKEATKLIDSKIAEADDRTLEEKIRTRAYQLYEARGHEDGTTGRTGSAPKLRSPPKPLNSCPEQTQYNLAGHMLGLWSGSDSRRQAGVRAALPTEN
jgi:hypothetical protein